MKEIKGFALPVIDTIDNWKFHNPIIPNGLVIDVIDGDTLLHKRGDGKSSYLDLPFCSDSRGLPGANGISGSLPDYNKIIDQPTTYTTYSSRRAFICDPFEEDGWAFASIYFSAADYAIMFFVDANDSRYQLYSWGARKGRNITPIVPVRKGGTIIIQAYSSGTTFTTPLPANGGIRFIPIHKPNLTEERIVGYINNEPVYERVITGISPDQNEGIVCDLSEFSVKNTLSVTGTFTLTNGIAIQLPTYYANTSNYCRVYVSADKKLAVQFAGNQYASANFVITLQYFKEN